MAAIQALQKWCKQQCEGYKDVSITNMTTSFRDGLAFCAILHRHRPELINFSSLSKENVFENNQLAFRVAESELGIPALLDAEDMVALKVPDRLSILTYVSQYYNYFHGKSPIGGMAGIKRPPSEASEEPAGKKAVPRPVTPAPRKPEPTAEPTSQGRSPVKQNAPVAARRILAENGSTRNSNCSVCGGHVHLVQRLLLDGKLYHRSCFRCKQCSNTLKPGNYKAGNDPGTFICTQHEHPAQPPNSLPVTPKDVARENKPATTVPTSGLCSKGLESRKPAPESIKTSQAFKSTDFTQRAVKEPSDSGNNKPHFSAASPNLRRSDPAGNKSVPRETSASPPPAPWTASAAKTQQAREKFFQVGLGTLGLPADRADPVKHHGVAYKPSPGTGKASALETPVQSTPPVNSEKDRARNILLHALPRSIPVSGGASPGASHRFLSSSSKPCAAPSGSQHLKPEKASANPIPRPAQALPAVEKPVRGSPGTLPGAKQAAQEPGTGTPAQNRARDQPFVRAVDSGQKQDAKAGKAGGARATEEKPEAPSDWRARLKPVANRVATQGDAGASQKPAEAHKVAVNIDLSPAKDDKKPTRPVTSPAIQDVAPSSEQPKKKKLLVPPLDISGGWQKTRQQWEDHSATQKLDVPGPPKRAVAPVRPASPRAFPKHPSGQVVSPSRLHPDYIPEEEIQKEFRQIERDLDKLELKGVDMEKHLRNCEGDDTEDALMVEWFKLIHEKQLLLRRESELMHKLNQQKLEEKQWGIESELRSLMNKSETLKSPREKAREDELLKSYLATVNDRNKIVEDLDEDRIREMEEDEMLAAMIQRLDVPRNTLESEKKKIRFNLFGLMKAKN
ncbi:MICAL-like protein 2 [Varanus komodoensis]|uniref:MICAL-like protein 2 n=1 Tax=Varanus komodoensis TaxID=61221 RepID=UPI001CF7A3AD|nr:MICAL-like protein 2 [Varanus komodoensis]